jgi:hypothetical protein
MSYSYGEGSLLVASPPKRVRAAPADSCPTCLPEQVTLGRGEWAPKIVVDRRSFNKKVHTYE